LVLALMISFHPMFSFVSAGINNDNLTNLIGLILIWQVLDLFESGLNLKKSLSIGFAAGLGILTKPLILPLLIAVGIAFIWEWTYSKRSLVKQVSLLAPLIIVSSLSGGWLVIKPFLETGRVPYFTQQKEYGLSNLKFIEYLKPQLGQYYRETLVWYWGVYKWLGVILPLNLIRLIKVLMIISGIGIVVEIFRKRVVQKNYQPWLLAMISFVFIASLTYWDYNGVRSNGFSHGLQGRYFFPTIGAHMSLLLIGILSITPKVWRRLVAKMTAVGMIIAQLISLKTLITAYYSTESVRVLFIQMSQYKPWFLKYPFSSIWLSFYGVLLSVLVYKILVYNHKETINK